MNTHPYSLNYGQAIRVFSEEWGKGAFHAKAFFQHLYSRGSADVTSLAGFANNPSLAAKASAFFAFAPPQIEKTMNTGDSVKLLLRFPDGARAETVLIRMHSYNTLCLSSQSGCARGCAFCLTGRGGLIRSLKTEELLLQWHAVRFILKEKIQNIVFMGMGEPFDNFEPVLKAMEILSHCWGPAIPMRRITVSTAGHVEGIGKLATLARERRGEDFHKLHLAVSLVSADNEVRSSLMPISRKWGLAELKETIRSYSLEGKGPVFLEYLILPGVNNRPGDAEKLADFARGLNVTVNLIPWNPVPGLPFERASLDEHVSPFFQELIALGLKCQIRNSKGKSNMAGCGQLGSIGAYRV